MSNFPPLIFTSNSQVNINSTTSHTLQHFHTPLPPMAPKPNSKSNISASSSSSQSLNPTFPILDDDDFQDYPSPSFSTAYRTSSLPAPLKPHNSTNPRQPKRPKKENPINPGKENCLFDEAETHLVGGLDSIEPTFDLLKPEGVGDYLRSNNSIESKLLEPCREEGNICEDELSEGSSQLDVLLKLCAEVDERDNDNARDFTETKCVDLICCPLCGADISGLSDDQRQIHTNGCLDLAEGSTDVRASLIFLIYCICSIFLANSCLWILVRLMRCTDGFPLGLCDHNLQYLNLKSKCREINCTPRRKVNSVYRTL